MGYTQTELNGWDYVIAISQEQINNGLALLYEDNKLPINFSKEESIFGMKVNITGEFGKPTVQAIQDGLKLCELIVPLQNATMQMSSGNNDIPKDAKLRIKTSLTSIESKIKHDDGKLYDVYVDFKNDNAVYDLHIDGMQDDQLSIIETMIKKEFQTLNGNEYKLTSFVIADNDLNKYIPRLVDFSFVLNPTNNDLSPFLLCCSLDDKGPQKENRLVFDHNTLPDGLPAALWVGKQFIFGKIILPLINDGIKSSYNNVNLIYDGDKNIKLSNVAYIGKPDGDHDAKMLEFNVYPEGGVFKINMMIKVFDISILSINSTAKIFSHIAIALTDDHTSFTSCSRVDSESVGTDDSLAVKIILGIITAGIIPAIEAILENVIERKVGSAMGGSLNDNLNKAVQAINNSTKDIPSLQDMATSGHLLFDGINLMDNGNLCIGIKDTKKA